MRDFTIQAFSHLLRSLQLQGFSFLTFAEYLRIRPQNAEPDNKDRKIIILRHDVESRYENALLFGEIQHSMGISGSYYFRILNDWLNREIIQRISDLGHETGYHYDDLSFCKGDHKAAIQRFEKHLNLLREIAPVQTITMEGAPLSKHDNKNLWKHNNYRDYGIIGEPYFDLSFGTEFNPTLNEKVGSWQLAVGSSRNPNPKHDTSTGSVSGTPNAECQTPNAECQTPNAEPQTPNAERQTPNAERQTLNPFFYLTDTGRRWDGWRYSVRDKVPQQKEWIKKGLIFRSTNDIIKAANEGRLPDKIMMTFHPQRWNDDFLPWAKELVWQRVKNVGKWIILSFRD